MTALIPRILVFAGSTRAGAYSGKVADCAQLELALQGAAVTRISLADYPLPLMNEDLEREHGVPENAVKLARLFVSHDALLICTPEYNSSLPPLLKNTIDWVSRVSKDGGRPLRPYAGKVVGLCSSSNGHFGGVRCIIHLRAILSHIGMEVVSPQVSVPNGADAFDENGGVQGRQAASEHGEALPYAHRACQTAVDAGGELMPRGRDCLYSFGLARRWLLCEWIRMPEFVGEGNDSRNP